MEAAPPSYEAATRTDPWVLIARYMTAGDLWASARICKKWHGIFTPHLWGSPASHFGLENDAVYLALNRFRKCLRRARLQVRLLTHTLHFPAGHPELYNGPHAEWLRDILEQLPNLQALIVRGLSFFDRAALQELRYVRKPANSYPVVRSIASGLNVPTSSRMASTLSPAGLRLLDASRCSNVTSSSLSDALSRFEGLLYLDLSFTFSSRDHRVLATLKSFPGLQVLKLRGIGLQDDAVVVLAKSIGLRVRSLDLRDNQVSDQGARALLNSSFLDSSLPLNSSQSEQHGRRSPLLLPQIGSEMMQIYQGEDFEGYLHSIFTNSFAGRLAIEDAHPGGITHLYISGNALTVHGVSELLRAERLHVLDVGPLRHKNNESSSHGPAASNSVHYVGSLSKALVEIATDSLTFLRIDHNIITAETATSSPVNVDKAGKFRQADSLAEDRNQDISAPEAIDSSDSLGQRVSHLSLESTTVKTATSNEDVHSSTSPSQDPTNQISNRRPTWSYSPMDAERAERLHAHMTTRHDLYPTMLPHVTTLVLTNVPQTSSDRIIADRLLEFIQNCAREASSARKQAQLDYSLPPGRQNQPSAQKHSADTIFALKRLVLELAPEPSKIRTRSHTNSWHYNDKSPVTEDRDSEAFWGASQSDYSFFSDDRARSPNLSSDSDDCSENADRGQPDTQNLQSSRDPSGDASSPKFDTVALLSAFRKERRLLHQQNIAEGGADAETEGYWSGIVQIVRPSDAARSDEEMDYYSNRFTSHDFSR